MKARFTVPIIILFCAATLCAQAWPQWGLNPQHTGATSVIGQNLNENLVNIIYDTLVPQEQAFAGGELLVHYQTPLVDGNDVYMEYKSGTYSGTDNSTQTWAESKYSWAGTTLALQWRFTTDWKAPGNQNDFWEPVFHPALANGYLYVPGAGGSIWKVNKSTGAGVRINPFPSVNSFTYTASPLTVDASGNILYNVIKQGGGTDFYQNDIADSWIVRVSPSDSIQLVSYSTLTAGAPGPRDQCYGTFSTSQLPWPPSPTAVPPTVTCGTTRPGINIAPAVAPDGTIYVVTRAQFDSRYGNMLAINPNLTQKWISSMRNRFNDGCGVPFSQGGQLPPNGTPGGCRAGAPLGVDPADNMPGSGRVLDDSSATVTIAPDGSVLYGAYTRYNYAQGHFMHWDSNGNYLGSYPFGWDSTPGIWSHGGTYSVVTKDNRYGGVGSYCNDDTICPPVRPAEYPEQYFIVQLNHNLNIEWMYQNTNTNSCTRNADGSITCVSDHPNGFEWCVNAWIVDGLGTVYANSEDGNLYKIPQGATGVTNIFQQLAIGAAYTPTSIGGDGKIYTQNAGHLFVAGN